MDQKHLKSNPLDNASIQCLNYNLLKAPETLQALQDFYTTHLFALPSQPITVHPSAHRLLPLFPRLGMGKNQKLCGLWEQLLWDVRGLMNTTGAGVLWHKRNIFIYNCEYKYCEGQSVIAFQIIEINCPAVVVCSGGLWGHLCFVAASVRNAREDSYLVTVVVSAGKDEEQEQAGAAAPGNHQRVRDEGGRENQRCGPGVAPHHCEEVGGVAQELHPGKTQVIYDCTPVKRSAVNIYLQWFTRALQ